MIGLYKRCRKWKVLPYKGGIFDQDERLMELFDVIDDEVDFWRRKRQQEQEGDMLSEQMKSRRAHGGR